MTGMQKKKAQTLVQSRNASQHAGLRTEGLVGDTIAGPGTG